jgi:hypothetical protein
MTTQLAQVSPKYKADIMEDVGFILFVKKLILLHTLAF